jgi:hypothetical protein
MKQVRKLAKGALIPLALLALIASSSIPASAASITLPSTVVTVKPNSISW